MKKDFVDGKSYDTESIESLIAHEFGHRAHVALALKRAKISYGEPISPINQVLLKQQYDLISQEIYIAAFKDESFISIQNACVEQLGEICLNNPHELIAQSFGNYYYGKNKSDIANAIVQYFKKGLK